MRLGTADVLVRAKTDKFNKDIDKSEKKVKGFAKNSSKALSGLSKSFVSLAGAAGFAVLTVKTTALIKESALLAARFETLDIVMKQVGGNAGYSASQMDAFDKNLRATGISMIESRNSLARMAQAQLDLNKATELGRIAQDAAVIGNINSSEAFQRMIYGIQSGQTEVLKTIGINVNFQNSYMAVAKAQGRVVTSLTVAEKAIIRQNTVLEYGSRIAGTYEAAMTTAGKKISSFTRYVEDFKVKLGLAFGPATVTLVDAATRAMKDFQTEISSPEAQESLKVLANLIAGITVDLGENLPSKIDGITKSISAMVEVYNSLPDGVIGSAGVGLLGKILTGSTPVGVFVGTMTLINAQMDQLGFGLSAMVQDYRDAVFAIDKIGEAITGKRDWNTGAQTLRFKIEEKPEVHRVKLSKEESPKNDVEDKSAQERIKFAERMLELKQLDMEVTRDFKIIEAELAADQIKNLEKKEKVLEAERESTTRWLSEMAEIAEAENKRMEAAALSWTSAAISGLDDYAESTKNVFGNIENAVSGAFTSMEDALADFCVTGKLDFADFASSIIRDMVRIYIQSQITGVLAQGLGSWWSGQTSVAPGGSGGGAASSGSTIAVSAQGNVFNSSSLSAYSGTVVDSPTMFRFAQGQGIMGEAGPEAIMPLTRLPGGDLGIKTESGRDTKRPLEIHIHEASGTQSRSEQSEDGMRLDIIIEQVEQGLTGRMNRGTGLAPFMDSRYSRSY